MSRSPAKLRVVLEQEGGGHRNLFEEERSIDGWDLRNVGCVLASIVDHAAHEQGMRVFAWASEEWASLNRESPDLGESEKRFLAACRAYLEDVEREIEASERVSKT